MSSGAPLARSRRTGAASQIILIGAGHAHIEVLRRFRLEPKPGIHLTIISKSADTAYSGMVPGYIAGHYQAADVLISVAHLAQFERCNFVAGEAVELDPDAGRVVLSDGRKISGDILSIDVGAATDTSSAPSDGTLIVPVKPIGRFTERWPEVLNRLQKEPHPRIAVAGAGAAGVELVLAIEHRLAGLRKSRLAGIPAEICLLERDDEILSGYPQSARRRLLRMLSARNIKVLTRFGGFDGKEGVNRKFDALIWAAGVRPADWLAASPLALDAAGFVAVDRYLQSTSHPGIFAAGDAAGMVESPRAKSGVIAVRQGPVLTENLHRAAIGSPLLPFSPQATWLSIIAAGDRYAVASRGAWSAEGRWVWYWKRWLDRSFVHRYAAS